MVASLEIRAKIYENKLFPTIFFNHVNSWRINFDQTSRVEATKGSLLQPKERYVISRDQRAILVI